MELIWQGCQAGEKLGLQDGAPQGKARLQGGQQSQRRQEKRVKAPDQHSEAEWRCPGWKMEIGQERMVIPDLQLWSP